MSNDRVLDLEGVHNFRDYGGYAVSGGGRLRRGRLWRSGQHVDASDADLARIAALDLAAVFDLRNAVERNAHPCRRPEGFAARVNFSEDTPQQHAPHIDAARGFSQITADSMRARMRQTYEGICFRPNLQAMMRGLMAEIADGGGPTLVNCLAGKDRTGIAAAMVHFATGVHRDDVIEDYLLTNTAGDAEARVVAGMAATAALIGPQDEAALRVLMGVEAEYIATAIASVEARHGSIDAYLADALGVDAALRDKLRDTLVEG